MGRIALEKSQYTIIEEGTYVFRIYEVDHDMKYNLLSIKLVNAEGNTHIERYDLNQLNARKAFTFLARTALDDFASDEINADDLVNRYFRAEVVHATAPSTKKPGESVTFVNLKNKEVADGFDTTPSEKAMTLGNEPAAGNYDLDALLG